LSVLSKIFCSIAVYTKHGEKGAVVAVLDNPWNHVFSGIGHRTPHLCSVFSEFLRYQYDIPMFYFSFYNSVKPLKSF